MKINFTRTFMCDNTKESPVNILNYALFVGDLLRGCPGMDITIDPKTDNVVVEIQEQEADLIRDLLLMKIEAINYLLKALP